MEKIFPMEGLMDVTLPVSKSTLPKWQQHIISQSPFSTPKKRPNAFKSSPCRSSPSQNDRFIPSRDSMDFDYCLYKLTNQDKKVDLNSGSRGVSQYKKTLEANLFEQKCRTKRVLSFNDCDNQVINARNTPLKVVYSCNQYRRSSLSNENQSGRHIPSSPSRILDAPELRDDYYLNLISWSKNNILAVALGQIVYLWNAVTGTIQEVQSCTEHGDYVTSVCWLGIGNQNELSVGTNHAEVQIWDVVALKQIRCTHRHQARVSSLAWSTDIRLLASGSRDSHILLDDPRSSSLNRSVALLAGHQQEVCGLSWSIDGSTLASGGNDNRLCLWDSSAIHTPSTSPRETITEHLAAVKAIAWCPWERNLLASGGGTADRTIKFWNTAASTNQTLLNSINTGSQVCGLLWSTREKEILSSHGFSQNELCLWKYPSMNKIKELTGHTARVLHMAISPDGSAVVSAAADETLRFWNVFAPSKNDCGMQLNNRSSLLMNKGIR